MKSSTENLIGALHYESSVTTGVASAMFIEAADRMEELARDAARYRWIMSDASDARRNDDPLISDAWTAITQCTKKKADSAIDAAIALLAKE